MNETFDLPVNYRQQELLLPARLQQTAYGHWFVVEIEGQEVIFEPDEEQQYRARIDAAEEPKAISPELLQAVANTLEELVK